MAEAKKEGDNSWAILTVIAVLLLGILLVAIIGAPNSRGPQGSALESAPLEPPDLSQNESFDRYLSTINDQNEAQSE